MIQGDLWCRQLYPLQLPGGNIPRWSSEKQGHDYIERTKWDQISCIFPFSYCFPKSASPPFRTKKRYCRYLCKLRKNKDLRFFSKLGINVSWAFIPWDWLSSKATMGKEKQRFYWRKWFSFLFALLRLSPRSSRWSFPISIRKKVTWKDTCRCTCWCIGTAQGPSDVQ